MIRRNGRCRSTNPVRKNAVFGDIEPDVVAVVLIDVDIPTRAVRVTMTIEEGLLARIDCAAEAAGETRSAFLAQAAEIHRQREAWQKHASRDLAEGRIQDAVRAYDADGAVYRSAGRETALGALLEDYFKDREAAGPQTTQLAFAHRRTDVFAINQAIRRALRTLDDMQAETIFVTETGPRAFAVGDRIVFTRNDKDIGVKNGMLGTVETVDGGRMSVRLDGDDGASRLVMFDPCRYRSFDHGYAVTIHKSQGATVGRAYVLASRTMDEPLTYVAMTRHQETLRLYLNDEDRPAWAMPENGGPQGRLARARRFEQS